MLLRRTSYGYAYAEDIPGSRCSPEDGPWPRQYRILDETELWRELGRLAKPQSMIFNPNQPYWRADYTNFQPSHRSKTQDRYVVTQLEVQGRKWSFTGVFDGHLGDDTVEHVAYHLPIIVRDFLRDALEGEKNRNDDAYGNYGPKQHKQAYGISPEFISDLFAKSIVAFDNAIANDVLDLFGGLEGLKDYSDAEIRNVINDQHDGGVNWKKARLCMYGTTALVTLVDPDHQNMWVANLGDCQAILVTPEDDSGNEWNVQVLTVNHNGDNDAEIDRVRRQHPNEPECVFDRRVLGALAPFRCLGDIPFKQPPEFTRRVLYNLLPGFHNVSPWEEFLVRNLTPPYITAEPDVIHRPLDNCTGTKSRGDDRTRSPKFLILASDGFTDLCGSPEMQVEVVKKWAKSAVPGSSSPSSPEPWYSWFSCKKDSNESKGAIQPDKLKRTSDNFALKLLRYALGEDTSSVSRVLTLDMETPWIDDTAIVVQTL
ncbi:hypothetical protein AX15_004958 [Amanita polypyramis BW_CC]|nr:hypothetical protein AX15_004958 [Amanita polypyramis BW_CC]